MQVFCVCSVVVLLKGSITVTIITLALGSFVLRLFHREVGGTAGAAVMPELEKWLGTT